LLKTNELSFLKSKKSELIGRIFGWMFNFSYVIFHFLELSVSQS
jgi:hypothetical protein